MNVSPLQPHNESQPDEQTLSQYAEHTRKSLIARLENWEDQRTWDEFYRTYWRLIYSVALKAGLREDEAWDVVLQTLALEHDPLAHQRPVPLEEKGHGHADESGCPRHVGTPHRQNPG